MQEKLNKSFHVLASKFKSVQEISSLIKQEKNQTAPGNQLKTKRKTWKNSTPRHTKNTKNFKQIMLTTIEKDIATLFSFSA